VLEFKLSNFSSMDANELRLENMEGDENSCLTSNGPPSQS